VEFAELANPDPGNAVAPQAMVCVTITAMRPSSRRRALFRVIDRITALFGGAAPQHWLSVVGLESGDLRSVTVTLHEVDGRTYITDLYSRAPGWGQDARAAGQATLTNGGTDTHITLTEVTDPVLKRQVLALRYGRTPPETFASFITQVPAVFAVTPAGVVT
jgi:hypothetical protein